MVWTAPASCRRRVQVMLEEQISLDLQGHSGSVSMFVGSWRVWYAHSEEVPAALQTIDARLLPIICCPSFCEQLLCLMYLNVVLCRVHQICLPSVNPQVWTFGHPQFVYRFDGLTFFWSRLVCQSHHGAEDGPKTAQFSFLAANDENLVGHDPCASLGSFLLFPIEAFKFWRISHPAQQDLQLIGQMSAEYFSGVVVGWQDFSLEQFIQRRMTRKKNTDVCANHVRISCRKIADHVAVWQYGHSLEFCISSRCAIRLQRASAKRVGWTIRCSLWILWLVNYFDSKEWDYIEVLASLLQIIQYIKNWDVSL